MRGQWLLSTLTQPNLNLFSFGTCVTKGGHVGWQGLPHSQQERLPGPRHLQTCAWVSCRCHINVFSVSTLLQFKGCWGGQQAKEGHHFPALGLAWDGLCPESPQRLQPSMSSISHKLWKGKFPSDIRKPPLHSKGVRHWDRLPRMGCERQVWIPLQTVKFKLDVVPPWACS